MKIAHGFLALSLATALAGGCTTKKYYTTTSDGGTSGGPASVSNISPGLAFTGRTLDVQISGSNTNWDSTTTVDFGSDVKVNKLTVGSASALTANITIADNAKAGARDVTVTAGSDAEAYKMTFNVQAALDVTILGSQQTGSVLVATIKNNDPLNHPFDTTMANGQSFTNIQLNFPTGVTGLVQSVTGSEIDAIITVDLSTAPGAIDIDVYSGADAQTASSCGTATCFEYVSPAAFTLTAQTPGALTNNAMVTLANPYDSKMFKYTPGGATHLLSLATADTNSNSTLFVLDSTGSFQKVLASGASLNYVTPDATALNVLVWDGAGAGNTMATVTLSDVALNVQSGGEGMDNAHQNDTIVGAVVLTTSPVIVENAQFEPDASMMTTSDIDMYKVTVTANQTIHAFTQPGDAGNATLLQFLDSTGTPIADASGSTDPQQDKNDYFSDDTTPALTAGTYYIKVTYGGGTSLFGPSYDPTMAHYNLIVVVH